MIEELRAGTHRGIVMVGMLVEGFDLPSLRVAGYHDKHKSLEPTAQIIGRLARVHGDYPQRSVLVTARDIDVYPHLEGAVRDLYAEDRDWAKVLPGIIDAYVEDDLKNSEYARSFGAGPGIVDPAHLHPLRRASMFELVDPGWLPAFHDGELPDALAVGETFAGQQILYAGTNPQHTTMLVVTGATARPRWNTGDELKEQELAGKKPKLNSGRARARADDLQARLDRRLTDLEEERQLSSLPPLVVGGALLIPAGLLARLRGERQQKPDEYARETERVERAAVDAVLAAEDALGREPREQPRNNKGFDVLSKDPTTGRLLFIEVKGRIEGAPTVTVSRSEILTGLNKPDDFVLALAAIPVAADAPPIVRYLRHPFRGSEDTYFDVTSVNFTWKTLWERGQEPS